MVEGYMRVECLGFITKYLQRFEVVDRQVWDAKKKNGDAKEVVEGVGAKYLLSPTLRDLAHQYALSNISLMKPWHK